MPPGTGLADLGRLDECLVAEVVVLTDETFERAKPVGVRGLPRLHLNVEVALEVGQVALERRDLHGYGQTTKDLVHGEKAVVGTEHLVNWVMGSAGLRD